MDLTQCPLSPMAIILATTDYSLILQRIVSVPQGMKSIIVIVSKEVRTMKKTIIMLSIVLTLCVAGVLYGKHHQTDEREAISLEEAYNAQYPEQMPVVIPEPMVGLLLY